MLHQQAADHIPNTNSHQQQHRSDSFQGRMASPATLQPSLGHPADDHRLTTTPPPPGFPQTTGGSSGTTSPGGGLIGSVSEYDGESLRGSGALSAPPGYHDGAEEGTRMANHILWEDHSRTEETPHHPIGGGSAWDAEQYNKRTTSFANLAALVGMGLAESMDDSTKADQMRSVEATIGGSRILDGVATPRAPMLFDPSQDLSYARQSRQTRSRLIGSRDPAAYSSSVSAAAGSLFALETGVRKSATPEPTRSSYDSEYSGSGEGGKDLMAVFKSSTLHGPNPFGAGCDGFGNEFGSGGVPRDVGVTVMEPGDIGRGSAPPQLFESVVSPATSRNETPSMSKAGTPVVSRQTTPVVSRNSVANAADLMEDLQRNMHNLGIELGSGHDLRSRQSSRSGSSGDLSSLLQSATAELEPFAWNAHQGEPSRGIVIFGVQSHRHVPDIRSTCEAFGSVEFFRADFVDLGFIVVAYYDIRSAEYAVVELKESLKRLASIERGAIDVDVKYCVALNWSAAQDESLLVVSDLPAHVSRENVMSVLSALGSIRAISHQQGSRYHGTVSYLVEFHNTSDAKQAVLELESVQPWGPGVLVEVGSRLPSDRRKGREFLSVLGRLKNALHGHKTPPPASPGPLASPGDPRSRVGEAVSVQRSGSPMIHPPNLSTISPYPNSDANSSSTLSQQTTQLVIGPDGRYSYVVVNPSAYPQHRHSDHMSETSSHHGMLRVVHQNGVPHHVAHQGAAHGSYIPPTAHGSQSPVPSHHILHHGQPSAGVHYQSSSYQSHQHYQQQGPSAQTVFVHDAYSGSQATVPYYAHVVTTTTDSSVSSGSVPNQSRRPPQLPDKHQDNRHLTLDIDAVETGQDTRTSLMVRNIPNKYTQQMLLSEFTENGHGPGVIDFFYLPIDFKNKCNRGYAFINFVNYRDIVTFHRRYFGQHWKVFNSDKICDITYARIQGKEGMLKRFENSALMEKDDGYKPLVFVSHGTEKGNRIPFPPATASSAATTS